MVYENFIGTNMSIFAGIPLYLVIIVLVWTFIWKGLALWKAARKSSVPWFVALLIINTLGILEILYIYVFSELGRAREKNVKIKSVKKKR